MLATLKNNTNRNNKPNDLARKPSESRNAFASQQNDCSVHNFNFNQIPLQAKLKINTPGDRYEQEADRIADRVVNMNNVGGIEESGNSNPVPIAIGSYRDQRKSLSDEITSISGLKAQRKCSQCEKEEEEVLQRKSLNSEPTTTSSTFNSQLNSTKSRGNSMDDPTNQNISSRFKVDFSHVNIYNDDKTAEQIVQMSKPNHHISKYSSSNQIIQREEKNEEVNEEVNEEELKINPEHEEELQKQPTEPDILAFKTPFFERGVPFLWDYDSALEAWRFGVGFYRRVGFGDELAKKAANLTTPLLINTQLSVDHPNFWEITDREMQTTTISGSLPLFDFDANFQGWRFLPFLQKKAQNSSSSITQSSENSGEQIANKETSKKIQSTKGNGNSLPESTKGFMESRFSRDFSKVKIHTDGNAAQLSQELHAKAFTIGNDIYFNKGEFQPKSITGKKLLAHELTHVVQQSITNASIQRKPNPKPSAAEMAAVKKAIAAQKMMWQDLKTFFPNDGRKLAGSSYDASVDYLKVDFTEGDLGGVSKSAPIMNVGKSYVDEADADVRKVKLETEMLKVDRFRVKKGRIDDDDIGNTTVFALIDGMDVKGKSKLVAMMKAQKHIENSNILEKIKKKMPSTPVASGATVRADGGFEHQFENIKIQVLPDVFNSSSVSGGVTKIEKTSAGAINLPSISFNGSGKITSIEGTMLVNPQIVYQIQTHYASGTDPSDNSGYGVGTESGAKGDEKHLRTHEGAHGETFINHIKNNIDANKFPEETVVVGDHKDKYNDHKTKFSAFVAMLKEADKKAVEDVDCAGTKTIQAYHHEHGTTTSVHCP